jgi:energy-coupling factor transporter ATP-binding protein EcfA2
VTRPDFPRRLDHLRRQLERDLRDLAPLRALRARELELEDLRADLERQAARSQAAAVLVLVGSTGAGKSTLLNALAGRVLAQASITRPTTAVPTVYAPADADLSALLDGLPNAPQVVRREPGAGGPLSELVLVDAPDTNSVATEHRATVSALAARADVLVVVLHRQSIVEQATLGWLAEFAARRELVLVLNRSDELTPQARGELLNQVRRAAAQHLGRPDLEPLAVSAGEACAGRGGADFERLLAELDGLVRDGRLASVRRHNALGVAAELARLGRAARAEAGADLAALEQELRAGLTALLDAVQSELERRLALRGAEFTTSLAAQAGAHWDGPGGWALRRGSWSTLGAGLGLLVARHNPWVAAGLAAGGAVAGHLQEDLGRRRLEAADALLPGPGELERLGAQHLGPARVRAGRLCGDPALLAIPSVAELEQRLAAAVGESWNRLLHRELPEAAERAVPGWLRWLLDLPVYALGGWVLYRAAMGFVAGDYAGLDFLLNGALLALALLCATRWLARLRLRARARGLLEQVSQDTGEALREQTERQLAPVAERVRSFDAGLSALGELDEQWREALASR